MNIAVVTTFPDNCWDIYAKQALQSFAQFWPDEIPLMVQLDDDLLYDQVNKLLRPQDGIAVGWEPGHKAFVERNKDKDDPTNYRKQPVRFCHKVFAIKRAFDAAMKQKAADPATAPRYLVWMDADVITQRKVTIAEIQECLPREGDAVAYMGRKDWDHSECGWLAFDLENGGLNLIEALYFVYKEDIILHYDQWHDSWAFDQQIKTKLQEQGPFLYKTTNLTANASGMDVWAQSPMGKWSTHYKGPQAKAKLVNEKLPPQQNGNMQSNIVIQTKNAIPHEEIRNNIAINQMLITKWIRQCKPTDEEIVVVSAGPMLVAEDVREEVMAGKRIVAVKHALKPLKEAGITPWACILLDPRPHVADFVNNPDTDVLWLVASQVDPKVTAKLIEAGCTVWGYHAAVGAEEQEMTKKQQGAIISGGSATATRGLFMLHHLGFRRFRLYGYDLCYPEKPDLKAIDDRGQPKYLEMSVGFNHPLYRLKRAFWSEPQFIAQFEEINDIIKCGKFELKAFGHGVIPFILKAKETGELRERELRAKINGKPPSYERLLKCSRKKKTRSLTRLPLKWLPSLRRRMMSSS
jgi:hypothetical protein